MLATAESCTGGELASRITNVSGASAVFGHGFVTYANEAKTQHLQVDAGLIQQHLRPTEHHIVEIDTAIYADLVQFAQGRSGVVSCPGDWRNVSLAAPFDFVFYDPFDYSSEPYDEVREAGLLLGLVGSGGVLCHPHFGNGPARTLPGFLTVVLEQFSVPEITMADGSRCACAAAVLCYPTG